MTAIPTFFGMPAEIRLAIYDCYLAEHQSISQNRQPSNAHIRLLHTCRQIDDEAGSMFRRYISLRHERQINAFILRADDSLAAQIRWADVANDGRVVSSGREEELQDASPLSNLHLGLRRMIALRHLRVFQCRQGLPINLQRSNIARLAIKFEYAMYPTGSQHDLSAYELFLDAETRVRPFDVVSPRSIERLRLSGDCHLPESPSMPVLRHVTLYGITGNYFDQHTVDQCFPGARLESFSYGLGHRLGFELRNHHLESLVSLSGAHLRKLVLLSCSRLTSTAIARCLEGLPLLDYFALSLITVDELRTNFILSMSPTISVVKIQVVNAWYAVPLLAEERGLCDILENTVLGRNTPPRQVCVEFRDRLMNEGGRQERWREIADNRHFELSIGPWENSYLEEL